MSVLRLSKVLEIFAWMHCIQKEFEAHDSWLSSFNNIADKFLSFKAFVCILNFVSQLQKSALKPVGKRSQSRFLSPCPEAATNIVSNSRFEASL